MNPQGRGMGQFNLNGTNRENRRVANRNTLIHAANGGALSFPDRFSSPIVGPDPPQILPQNYLSSPVSVGRGTGIVISSSAFGNLNNINRNVGNQNVSAAGVENHRSAAGGHASYSDQNVQSAPNPAITTGGGGSMSGLMRRTPFKRRSPDAEFGRWEFVAGESSNGGGGSSNNAQAEAEETDDAAAAAAAAAAGGGIVPARRAPNENNNGSISSAVCTCITCPLHATPGHHNHEPAGSGNGHHGAGGNVPWSSEEVQRALRNRSSDMDLPYQAAASANPQGLVPITNMMYQSSSSSPPIGVFDHHRCPIHRHPNSNYHNHYTPYWANIMRPSSNTTPSPPSSPSPMTVTIMSSLPPSSGTISDQTAIPPAHQGAERNINTVRGVNYYAVFPQQPRVGGSSHFGGGARRPPPQLSNSALAWVQRLNAHHEYLARAYPPSGTAPAANNNFVIRSNLVDPNRAIGILARNPRPLPLPPFIADINVVRQEIRNAIRHLLNGGSIPIEELLILDYSVVLNLLDSIAEDEAAAQRDRPLPPYEGIIFNIVQPVRNVAEAGLTEREVVTFLPMEICRPNGRDHDLCAICQDNFMDGQELGRLDCGHKYHFDCIRQWLTIKNLCPICKQTALGIAANIEDGDDDDEEEEEEEDADN